MIYKNIYSGIFLNRPNRFLANVLIDGEKELVHVKNTGRCKEILIEGTKVYLEKSNNPKRKTRYSLISAYKNNSLINIDSQVPNKVIYDAIKENKIEALNNVDLLKKEVTYKQSRFDLYYEKDNLKGFIEIKGVTLEDNGICLFPDAPTERGVKHIKELIESKKEGFTSYLIFLIQLDNISKFTPNKKMHPSFYTNLKLAKEEGINILAYNSNVGPNSIDIDKEIDIFF